MQVTRQMSKGKGGLRLWNGALGIRVNRDTPRTRQPLIGVTLWGCVVGMALVLMGQVAWAHDTGEPLPMPTCSGLPADTYFSAAPAATALTLDKDGVSGYATAQTLPMKAGSDDATDGGDSDFRYGRITVPALTAGELKVLAPEGDPDEPTNAILCAPNAARPLVAEGITTYTSAHVAADRAAKAAQDAATAARTAATNAELAEGNEDRLTVQGMDDAVDAAIRALDAAFRALTAVDRIEGVTMIAQTDYDAITAARDDLDDLLPIDTNTDRATVATELNSAATALNDTSANPPTAGAAPALRAAIADQHEGLSLTAYLSPMTAALSPGDDTATYVVVMAHHDDDTTTPAVTVEFRGLMGTGSVTQAIGSANKTYSFPFETNVAGLFMGDTSGVAVSGVLESGEAATPDATGNDVGISTGMGKVDITAPLLTVGDHVLTATYTAASGAGNVTLNAWFRPSTLLTIGTDLPGEIEKAGQALYYHFTSTAGILTLRAEAAIVMGADTRGVLYAKNGQIAMNMDRSGGKILRLCFPWPPMARMCWKSKAIPPRFVGEFTIESDAGTATPITLPAVTDDAVTEITGASPHRYIFDATEAGWVQVRITSTDDNYDTNAELRGPDNMVVKSAAGMEQHPNFAAMIVPGIHLLSVSFTGTGTYQLNVNFIEGVAFETPPTILPPPARDVSGFETQLAGFTEAEQMQICESVGLGHSAEPGNGGTGGGSSGGGSSGGGSSGGGGGGGGGSTTRPDPAPLGYIEDPSGVRSGIGMIRGWICEAPDQVRVHVFDSDGVRVLNLRAAYGTTRSDTRSSCGQDNTGFGLTYNFNLLDEGMYTVQVLADGDQIGLGGNPQTNRFEVVHLSESEYLTGLDAECVVPDFPEDGYETSLEWEESLQNFVISSVMEMEEEAQQ